MRSRVAGSCIGRLVRAAMVAKICPRAGLVNPPIFQVVTTCDSPKGYSHSRAHARSKIYASLKSRHFLSPKGGYKKSVMFCHGDVCNVKKQCVSKIGVRLTGVQIRVKDDNHFYG